MILLVREDFPKVSLKALKNKDPGSRYTMLTSEHQILSEYRWGETMESGEATRSSTRHQSNVVDYNDLIGLSPLGRP